MNAHLSRTEIEARIRELGPWFHNLELHGVMTAPEHFLGDYPRQKWKRFAHAIPPDLRGKTVLDIGCNAGFYSLEMKRRGARHVVAIDSDDHYLAQARFAAQVTGIDIDIRRMDVYRVAELGTKFDLVFFMGVLYHLRHPLLALDLLRQHVVGDTLIFQSMQRGSRDVELLAKDYPFSETEVFERPGYPKMHFVEHRYSDDWTNWWIPNRACVEAMLRSSGFHIEARPEDEVYICTTEGGRP
ncbi:MAG: Methyltransferase type 12 [Labilithrix sp.]|nr:Methyltransferase type 12 [Labilithrix sp.]